MEFFDLCARRLKPGGVVCTWAPTPRIAATFARVFPEAVDVGGILVGRLVVPADADRAVVEAAARTEVASHLDGATVRKVVFVPGRLVNFVVG